jgi:phosphoketolase
VNKMQVTTPGLPHWSARTACAGEMPTMEVPAVAGILRGWFPDLRIRVVNVVDLMRLQDDLEHPHGLPDRDFDALFTTDRPIIFNYHGYPWLIHRLTYRRANRQYVRSHGEDMPQVRDWRWSAIPGPAAQAENPPLTEPV